MRSYSMCHLCVSCNFKSVFQYNLGYFFVCVFARCRTILSKFRSKDRLFKHRPERKPITLKLESHVYPKLRNKRIFLRDAKTRKAKIGFAPDHFSSDFACLSGLFGIKINCMKLWKFGDISKDSLY
jgi:hypothetical protein